MGKILSIQEKIQVSSLSAAFSAHGQQFWGPLGVGLGFVACRMGRIGVACKMEALGPPPQGRRKVDWNGDSGKWAERVGWRADW